MLRPKSPPPRTQDTLAVARLSPPLRVQAMATWSVKTRRAPSWHCKDVKIYYLKTPAMHDTSAPRPNKWRVVVFLSFFFLFLPLPLPLLPLDLPLAVRHATYNTAICVSFDIMSLRLTACHIIFAAAFRMVCRTIIARRGREVVLATYNDQGVSRNCSPATCIGNPYGFRVCLSYECVLCSLAMLRATEARFTIVNSNFQLNKLARKRFYPQRPSEQLRLVVVIGVIPPPPRYVPLLFNLA